ncbi:unnamed protein product [Aspergillus oryzae]|uniref:Unnamed protein product n=1 Tax=Aspergillus oryzae TaxID=5062 RepID=A0AAN4YP20_ASPOZ|nr:unnamed protein product [Aspergillus oryzae]GMF83282.1 unnamed protein product [Aspergillus oryzae]GMG33304.1 unnamed protein product [Aspergillus oryzae]
MMIDSPLANCKAFNLSPLTDSAILPSGEQKPVSPAPHPCLAYAASSQIFVTVTKLALSSYDDGMLRSATVFFNTLIDSEVDGVVDNRLFARALVDLVRRADKHSEDVEGRLVELLFGVANNIRLQPDILPAWFAPRSEDQDREQQTNTGAEFAGATRKDDFPLFYLLVEYVHHGGRAGDFARTGLLYLIETASRSKNLERWLIESDLATLMATGLGALYPSLLESSDVEGGSTAAVLTYLYRILESINQDDLVHRILHFLLASPSDMETSPTLKVNMSVSRRKSLDVLAAFSEEAAKPSPSLFNLRDLALLGLQSANRQTVLATLRLMAVILQRHHTFARSLIRTVPGQYAGQRTVGQLNAELEQLTEMATSIVEDPTLNDSFEDYLKDASLILESHLYIPPAETGLEDDRPLEIRQEDPIVQELLNCVETFFTNSVIVNLALTEVLMSIASSHLISLDSWLLVDPSKYVYDDQTTAQDGPMEILDQIKLAYQEPSLSSSETPTLTSALQKLVQKIQQWRKDVPDFDILVAARRDLLHHDDPAKDTGRLQQPFEASTRLPSERRPLKMPLDSDIGSPRGRSSLVQDLPGTPASRQAAVGSPLRGSSLRSPDSRESSSPRMTAAEELRKRLSKPFQVDHPHKATMAGEEPEPAADAIVEEEAESAIADEEPRSATLGHVLTNVVILYEFLLEVSATVQARSTLFGEAGYPGVGWSAPLDEELM